MKYLNEIKFFILPYKLIILYFFIINLLFKIIHKFKVYEEIEPVYIY
jgi:hypothetical protein